MNLIQRNTDIGQLIRRAENDYVNGQVQTSRYVNESIFDDVNRIEAYLNSKHISGEEDSLGREKPFFNIVTAARNIWFRATDIDRKDIKIRPSKSKEYITSFLASVHLHDWMRRVNFGQFLNDWGLTLASYNSAVIKFVEKDGQLFTIVVPWTRLIVDQIDFASNPKIEILELTPAQLRSRKGYNQEIVQKLIESLDARKNQDGTKKDNKSDYIRLYEIHGELPKSYLTGDSEDSEDFLQQMHVVSFVSGKDEGEYDDFTLYSGKESKDPYMLTSLIPNIDGSISLNGSVKQLFEAQWMMNHTTKAIKDQLDLASKMIFQTSDGNFIGQNALEAIETGDILIHKPQEPLTQLANNSHDITSLQAFGNQWKIQAQEITSTPDILLGQNMPSGTAFRQAAIIQQESHSNFEIMTENKGLAIEKMLREYIIPFLKTKMDTSEEISSKLEDNDLARIDRAYIKNAANKNVANKIIDSLLNDEIPEEIDMQGAMADVESEFEGMGNQRFFKPSEIDTVTWKELFKDLEWDVEVNITGEYENKQVVLETLRNVLQTIAANPAVLTDPNIKLLFNKILTETGVISPVELTSIPKQSPMVAPVTQSTVTPNSEKVGQMMNTTNQTQ